MCTHPVSIRSPKYKANTFLFGIDKECLLVPCGHCEECQRKKRDDLTFRLYYEYLSTVSDGGFSLSTTLTYSERYVPKFGGFRFFCRRDVTNFIKRLRKYLTKLRYPHEGRLSYVITSEFGCLTFRPHYHVFFGVHFKIDVNIFYNLVRRAWQRKELGDFQSIGFVDNRDVQELVINSVAGCRYVSKYVCKGSSAVDALFKQGDSNLLAYVRNFCNENSAEFDLNYLKPWQLSRIYKLYQEYNPYCRDYQLMPFVAMSHGVGLDFLNNVDYLDLLDVCSIQDSKSLNNFKDYSIPMYFIRKVFYRYDKISKRFILNELGKDYFKKQRHNEIQSLQDFFVTSSKVLNEVVFDISKGVYSDIQSLCSNYIGSRSLNHFIKYVVFFKGRHIHPTMRMLYDKFDDLNIDDAAQQQEDILISSYLSDSQQFVFVDDLKRNSLYLVEDKCKTAYLPMYNSLPEFELYDVLYDYLNRIRLKFKSFKEDMMKVRKEQEYQLELIKAPLKLSNSIIV